MVYINSGEKKQLVIWFMDLMVVNNVYFDYLGLLFYFGDGVLLLDLKVFLVMVVGWYNKFMVIVEVVDYWMLLFNSLGMQKLMLEELMKVVRVVLNGLGVGVCYWELGWLKFGEVYFGEGNYYWICVFWDEQGMLLFVLWCYEFFVFECFVQFIIVWYVELQKRGIWNVGCVFGGLFFMVFGNYVYIKGILGGFVSNIFKIEIFYYVFEIFKEYVFI